MGREKAEDWWGKRKESFWTNGSFAATGGANARNEWRQSLKARRLGRSSFEWRVGGGISLKLGSTLDHLIYLFIRREVSSSASRGTVYHISSYSAARECLVAAQRRTTGRRKKEKCRCSVEREIPRESTSRGCYFEAETHR